MKGNDKMKRALEFDTGKKKVNTEISELNRGFDFVSRRENSVQSMRELSVPLPSEQAVESENAENGENQEVWIKLDTVSGESVDCLVVAIFEVNGKNYIALSPNGGEEVILFEYADTGNAEDIEIADIDEEEYEIIEQAFYAIMED